MNIPAIVKTAESDIERILAIPGEIVALAKNARAELDAIKAEAEAVVSDKIGLARAALASLKAEVAPAAAVVAKPTT